MTRRDFSAGSCHAGVVDLNETGTASLAGMMVAVSDTAFSYATGIRTGNGAPALDGISLNIARGEFVALLGQNGSGKSTLARLLNALLLPDSGVVCVGGIDTRDESLRWEVRRLAGMVFQNPDNQIVGTTVEEDAAFGPENLGLPAAEIAGRVREALEAVALTGQEGRAPHLLSAGEKQRLALAGVLAMQPSCVILDEATAMLDPASRGEVMALLRRLNREEGITVVQITHHVEEAALADRIIVLDAGKVVLDGSPAAVFSDAQVIRELGLGLPPVTELFDLLAQDGFALPVGVVDIDEAVGLLSRLAADGGHDGHSY